MILDPRTKKVHTDEFAALERLRIAKLAQAIEQHPNGCLTEAAEWTWQAIHEQRDQLNDARWQVDNACCGPVGELVRSVTGCTLAEARAAELAAQRQSRATLAIATLSAYCRSRGIPTGVCR